MVWLQLVGELLSETRMEEIIEVMERQGTTCKQLLDDFKKKSGYRKFKHEALDRGVLRTRLVRGYGPVVRRYIERMNEWMNEWLSL
jgi:hypothetical protein